MKCNAIKISSVINRCGLNVLLMSTTGYAYAGAEGAEKRSPRGSHLRFLPLLLVLMVAAHAWAAGEADEGTVSGEVTERLGVVAFGVSGGFPAYQAYAVDASMQYRYLGIAARGSWTSSAGVYGSLEVRGYPPIPGSPVPVFLSAGVGSHRAGLTSFAAAGVHVPLAQHIRLDLQAGAVRVPLLDQYDFVPYLSIGTSYAFSFDISPALETSRARRAEEARERAVATGIGCEGEPEPSMVNSAVSSTVSAFLRDAQATYGSLYRNLQYSYEITDTDVDGDKASARIRYEGSATEVASGRTISASGSASARYRWNGCSWRRTSLNY